MISALLTIIVAGISMWISWVLVVSAAPQMLPWLITAWVLSVAAHIARKI